MRNRIRPMIVALLAVFAADVATAAAYPPKKTLQAFSSEQEISQLFGRWHDEYQRRQRDAAGRRAENAPPQAVMSAPAAAKSADSAGAAAESVTNVQHAGVDEGGIVKLHGDHLVILRRGRLFTVSVRDRELKPVSTADAFGAGIDPSGAWYDEMLISGDTVVVIGYSYARGGTEIGLFDISGAGELRYRATYHLRSNDYYSSRNYASRLVGTRLVFYTPLYLNPWGGSPFASFPAMRRWQSGATDADWKRIAPATRIYRTDEALDPSNGVALHTVTTCELARPEMECSSTAVMGPPGRVFYVSPGSVYVWTTTYARRGTTTNPAGGSAVFRIPLDGGAPSALKTAGSPIDQFSFLESGDGHLNVLLRPPGAGGDVMWAGERNTGQLGLMRVALTSFSDGKDSAPRAAYRALPTPDGGSLQNRYIGDYLVYGAGAGWRRPTETRQATAYAVRYGSRNDADELPLPHGVDRIEALGANAVLVGSDGRDLHFTSVRLGSRASVASRYTRANASQGETRSHGFYYRSETGEDGLVGLPIIGGGEGAYQQLRRTSASLLYLRNRALELSEIGTLDAHADSNANDNCRASCVDWYGNSRPLFVRGRVFALLGYEIVEGRIVGARIGEVRRINYSPSWLDRTSRRGDEVTK